MRTLFAFGFVCVLAVGPSLGADAPAGTVRDYEVRLEELSKEVQDIRREIEKLVQEVVEGETGRLFLFLEGATPEFREKGVSLSIDGKTVFARALTPAEIDVLGKGLPLELAELRVAGGEHRVALVPLGAGSEEAETLKTERGKVASWVARPGPKGLEWRSE